MRPNRLASETSAYLLQHRDNPVDWYPWGELAFARARELDRPVLVSIGYSSCHWCHVMERESFQSAETAQLMNELLVCIKVDREERPDVDQIYMNTVMRLTGHGGWPLTVFCLPDGRPVFGGTYYPPSAAHGRPGFPDVIRAVSKAYVERRDSLEEQAAQILEVLRQKPESGRLAGSWSAVLSAFSTALMERADREHGGFGGTPKFPTPTNLEALLLASALGLAPRDALAHVRFTLVRMSRGGIFDQLGGGFHRYSTDARWLVPHFEKMLYDQGQLLRVYAETYRQCGDEALRWPVAETIAYLERELRSPEGGLFASQDADSEGEEGRYYVWSPAQIEAQLGPERGRAFCEAHGVSERGSFERSGRSVLEQQSAATDRGAFAAERERLRAARTERVPPATDRKQITAWIAYAIGGMASAGAAFERPDWVAAAARSADFLCAKLRDPTGRWLRIWDGERARIPGFLDDHAALLCALLDLHRAGAQHRYLELALEIAALLAERFFDPAGQRFWFTSGEDPSLVYRPETDGDGATPSASGLATLGLVRAAALSGRRELGEAADAVLAAQGGLAERIPLALPTLVRAGVLRELDPGLGLVLGDPAAPGAQALARRARALLSSEEPVALVRPGEAPGGLDPGWLEGREARGGPLAYLCRGRTCSPPAREPEALRLPGAS